MVESGLRHPQHFAFAITSGLNRKVIYREEEHENIDEIFPKDYGATQINFIESLAIGMMGHLPQLDEIIIDSTSFHAFSNGYNFMDTTALLREMGENGIRSPEPLASHVSTPIPAEDILHSALSDSLGRQDAYPLSEMKTNIDRALEAFDIDKMELVAIAKYFTQHRSESELIWFPQRFRARFPPESEWIWPLLDQFRHYQGKSVVVVLLQCPRRNDHINKPSNSPCFTHEIANVIESCFQPLGPGTLRLYFRKQCRRRRLVFFQRRDPGSGALTEASGFVDSLACTSQQWADEALPDINPLGLRAELEEARRGQSPGADSSDPSITSPPSPRQGIGGLNSFPIPELERTTHTWHTAYSDALTAYLQKHPQYLSLEPYKVGSDRSTQRIEANTRSTTSCENGEISLPDNITKHIIRLQGPDGKYSKTIEAGASPGLEYSISDMMYEERWLMEAAPRHRRVHRQSRTTLFPPRRKEISVHGIGHQENALWEPQQCQAPNQNQVGDCVDGWRRSAAPIVIFQVLPRASIATSCTTKDGTKDA
ncbi:hypothetical protein FMEXI_2461 [Fusarium mexicanum]|uniref:Uncharacterized protein n=1 Tax=Fusarium mexicanum TaxID=751941 RepID=A0A8H5N5G8_9HYPO|nr:hypothetical protein FMEXI_2461 [Fusarium mexicanum]